MWSHAEVTACRKWGEEDRQVLNLLSCETPYKFSRWKLSDFKGFVIIMWEIENILSNFKISTEDLKLQRNLILLCPVTCRLTVNQFMDLRNDVLFMNSLNHISLSFLRLLITNRCLSIYLDLKKSFPSLTVTEVCQSWK